MVAPLAFGGSARVVAAAVFGWWFFRYGERTASQLQSTLLGNGGPEAVPWALLIQWDGL